MERTRPASHDTREVIEASRREAAERQLRHAIETGDLGAVAELTRNIARVRAAGSAVRDDDRHARLVRDDD